MPIDAMQFFFLETGLIFIDISKSLHSKSCKDTLEESKKYNTILARSSSRSSPTLMVGAATRRIEEIRRVWSLKLTSFPMMVHKFLLALRAAYRKHRHTLLPMNAQAELDGHWPPHRRSTRNLAPQSLPGSPAHRTTTNPEGE